MFNPLAYLSIIIVGTGLIKVVAYQIYRINLLMIEDKTSILVEAKLAELIELKNANIDFQDKYTSILEKVTYLEQLNTFLILTIAIILVILYIKFLIPKFFKT